MSAAERLNRSRCHLACGLQGAQQTITRWGPGSPTGKGTSGIIPEYDHACQRSIYSTLFARGQQRCSYLLSLCCQQLSANLTQLILHSLEGVGEFNGASTHFTLHCIWIPHRQACNTTFWLSNKINTASDRQFEFTAEQCWRFINRYTRLSNITLVNMHSHNTNALLWLLWCTYALCTFSNRRIVNYW